MEKSYLELIKPYFSTLEPQHPIPTGVEAEFTPEPTKTVIFDIYGTLLVSASGDVDKAEFASWMIKKALEGGNYIIKDTSEACLAELYKKFGNTIITEHNKAREQGFPYPEIDVLSIWESVIQRAISHGCIATTPKSDIRLFTFIFELYSNKVWPMPGMKELIFKLKENNVNLGIVSNAQFYTPIIMNYFLGNEKVIEQSIHPFDQELSVFSYREKRGKPDVALFDPLIKGLQRKGIKPSDAYFVGNDMLKDVYTAQESGLKTVFFTGDKRSYRPRLNDERVKGRKANHIITELDQILKILEIE